MPYDTRAFNYDYGLHSRRSNYRYQQKSQLTTTTTPRPFFAYWQNIMRNVRVPVPSITWNVTNPLANFFTPSNVENAETLPIDDYYAEQTQRRHKQKRKRNKNNRKNNKHRRKQEHSLLNETNQEEEIQEQTESIDQHQYPNNIDPHTPMLFYDPTTSAYYAVQRVKSFNPYMEETFHSPSSHAISYENDERRSDKMDETLNGETTTEEYENLDSIDNGNINESDLKEQNYRNENGIDVSSIDVQENKEKEIVKNTFLDEETMRNVLGSYMADDYYNRQRQRVNNKRKISNKQESSKDLKYYFVIDVNK